MGGNTWYREDIGVRYVLSDTTLSINGNTTIIDFKNGDLGIFLEKPLKEDEEEDPTDSDDILSEPIILDLTGNGINTTDVRNGQYVDFNGDGFAEKLAWAGDGNGVLIIDSNQNGIIDNSSKILTAETLSLLDTNYDGKIDYQDEYFNNLKISEHHSLRFLKYHAQYMVQLYRDMLSFLHVLKPTRHSCFS